MKYIFYVCLLFCFISVSCSKNDGCNAQSFVGSWKGIRTPKVSWTNADVAIKIHACSSGQDLIIDGGYYLHEELVNVSGCGFQKEFLQNNNFRTLRGSLASDNNSLIIMHSIGGVNFEYRLVKD